MKKLLIALSLFFTVGCNSIEGDYKMKVQNFDIVYDVSFKNDSLYNSRNNKAVCDYKIDNGIIYFGDGCGFNDIIIDKINEEYIIGTFIENNKSVVFKKFNQ